MWRTGKHGGEHQLHNRQTCCALLGQPGSCCQAALQPQGLSAATSTSRTLLRSSCILVGSIAQGSHMISISLLTKEPVPVRAFNAMHSSPGMIADPPQDLCSRAYVKLEWVLSACLDCEHPSAWHPRSPFVSFHFCSQWRAMRHQPQLQSQHALQHHSPGTPL